MKKISERVLAQGTWISMKEILLESAGGERFTWESVVRCKSNVVAIVYAVLRPSGRVILISQYRPVVENYVLALPAGFVEGEDAAAGALRELREETGYVGTVRSISPALAVNAALLDDRLYLVEVDVDEELPENRTPLQELEPSEEIETFLVPRADVKQFLLDRVAAGFAVASGLWYMFCVSTRD